MRLTHISPLFFVLVLALGLRLPQLNGSFWMDEAAQALESNRPLSQQFDIAKDFQPPLIHLLTHAASRVSNQEWWLRTISALTPGLLSIAFTFLIAKKLHSEKAGVIASLLLATSSLHIFYSQELRPYTLPVLWATLSWWLLMSWLDTPKKSIPAWYTVSNILGLYSSYLYPFLLFSQVSWVLWQHRNRVVPFIASMVVVALGFAPWVPMFLQQLEQGGFVRQQLPTWETVVSIPQLKAVLLIPAKFIFGVLNVEFTTFYSGVFVIAIVTIAGLLFQTLKRKTSNRKQLYLLLNWLLVPFITSWLVSFMIPVVQPKRLLYLLPALYILVAYIALSQKRALHKKIGSFLIGILLVINFISSIFYYTDPRLQRENWRDLHQEITRTFSPQNTIAVFAFYEPIASWIWYDQGTFPTWSSETLHINNIDNLSDSLKVVTEYEYVLLFEYLRDLTDPDDKLRNELWAFGYTEVRTIDYPNIGFVRVYTRNKPVAEH